ncbi:MAG: hypothetical protein ACR2M5_07755 [Nakamurella sp.]
MSFEHPQSADAERLASLLLAQAKRSREEVTARRQPVRNPRGGFARGEHFTPRIPMAVTDFFDQHPDRSAETQH